MSHDGVVTVDGGGCVRLWETALMNLDKSLRGWRSLLGEASDKPLQVGCDDNNNNNNIDDDDDIECFS